MTTTKTYSKNHPLRIKGGENRGKLPHELEPAAFNKYLILGGMDEDYYYENLKRGEEYARSVENSTRQIVPTNKLTADQRGWAKADYPEHFASGGSWIIRPEKVNRPVPMALFKVKRQGLKITQTNNGNCCDESRVRLYGTTYNNTVLVECRHCGMIMKAG